MGEEAADDGPRLKKGIFNLFKPGKKTKTLGVLGGGVFTRFSQQVHRLHAILRQFCDRYNKEELEVLSPSSKDVADMLRSIRLMKRIIGRRVLPRKGTLVRLLRDERVITKSWGPCREKQHVVAFENEFVDEIRVMVRTIRKVEPPLLQWKAGRQLRTFDRSDLTQGIDLLLKIVTKMEARAMEVEQVVKEHRRANAAK
jgi:hypothetical protein